MFQSMLCLKETYILHGCRVCLRLWAVGATRAFCLICRVLWIRITASLIDRVFYKVKSRNAHMKSHRPPDAESKRKGEPQRHTPPSPQSQRPPPGRAKLAGAHHLGELPCLEPAMLSLPNQGYVIPNM